MASTVLRGRAGSELAAPVPPPRIRKASASGAAVLEEAQGVVVVPAGGSVTCGSDDRAVSQNPLKEWREKGLQVLELCSGSAQLSAACIGVGLCAVGVDWNNRFKSLAPWVKVNLADNVGCDQILQAGWAVVQDNDAKVFFGPLPFAHVSILLAELLAVLMALAFAIDATDLIIDNMQVVNGLVKGETYCMGSGRPHAHVWRRIWAKIADAGYAPGAGPEARPRIWHQK